MFVKCSLHLKCHVSAHGPLTRTSDIETYLSNDKVLGGGYHNHKSTPPCYLLGYQHSRLQHYIQSADEPLILIRRDNPTQRHNPEIPLYFGSIRHPAWT